MIKPVVLIILDGWGYNLDKFGNSVLLANKPNFDYLWNNYPNTLLNASGKHVGLPEGQMGNSEVGHLNIGAGRIVYTGLSLINKEIENNTFKDRDEVKDFLSTVKNKGSKLHFMTLASFGGVHSNLNHLFYLSDMCHKLNQEYVAHLFTDGRDVSPHQAEKDIVQVMDVLNKTKGKLGVISGRYYSMDRDKNWDRTVLAYEYLTGQKSDNSFSCPKQYIKSCYDASITDEFIKPAINTSDSDNIISPGDVIVFLNFRPDRAKQLSHLFVGSTIYDYQDHKSLSNITCYSLMKYDGVLTKSLLPHVNLKNTLGEVLHNNNISQLRIAETEKYPHVTHFFDGGKAVDYIKMKKILIPSPKVATYDLKPEMSAPEIGENVLQELPKHHAIILNFANADMVGHSGSLEATKKACEAVDEQLGKIYKKVLELDGTLLVIADHGNAEVMINSDNSVNTAHTINLVPCILVSNKKEEYKLRQDHNNLKLADVAPTLLQLLNIEQPSEMDGQSIINE